MAADFLSPLKVASGLSLQSRSRRQTSPSKAEANVTDGMLLGILVMVGKAEGKRLGIKDGRRLGTELG